MGVQLICSLVGAAINISMLHGELEKAWYLLEPGQEQHKDENPVIVEFLISTAIWFIALMNFVPISLLVSLELINFIQAYFMTVDI